MLRFDRSLPALLGLCVFAILGLACAGGGSSGSGSGGATETGGATGLGGASPTGGSTGSGGATGKGGTTGAGGVLGSGGATATGGSGSTACTNCRLTIASQCQTGPDTQTIRVIVDVQDAAISALSLADVTFRYWFVMGTTTDKPVMTIDYAAISQVTGATITSTFAAVSPARTGANEYLEVGFGPNTPPLTLFGDTGQIKMQFHGMNNSTSFDLDQTSDYSYRACGGSASTDFTSAPTITGYINGTLAWGTEPQ